MDSNELVPGPESVNPGFHNRTKEFSQYEKWDGILGFTYEFNLSIPLETRIFSAFDRPSGSNQELPFMYEVDLELFFDTERTPEDPVDNTMCMKHCLRIEQPCIDSTPYDVIYPDFNDDAHIIHQENRHHASTHSIISKTGTDIDPDTVFIATK
jgi:hypothetical protein